MINLTPHKIEVRYNGVGMTFEPSGKVARVAMIEKVEGDWAGVPVISRVAGKVEIPEVPQGEPILVSSMVLDAMRQQGIQMEAYAPDTGPTAIRENGNIVAVTRLVKL